MVTLAAGRLPQAEQRRFEQARESLTGKTPRGFEWVDQLSHAHQRQFAVELYRVLAEATINYEPQKLAQLLDSWKATAELDGAPEVAERILKPREGKKYVDWSP